jgi:alpha-beta hydrolase superfamily lysophospholipase
LEQSHPAPFSAVFITNIAESNFRHTQPVTARKIAERYGARAEFHEVPGHAHFMFLEPGWEQIAERCAEWMSNLPKT